MADGSNPKKSKNVLSINIIDSLLKTGNNTAIINVKKLHFIHTVNGEKSKTEKKS